MVSLRGLQIDIILIVCLSRKINELKANLMNAFTCIINKPLFSPFIPNVVNIWLTKSFNKFFQMMHVVPSCASPVPYFSPSYSPESYSPESPPDLTFEFDLNLLPSSDCADVVPGLDLPLPIPTDPFQEVPSPSSSFTFLDSSLHSPTMFSPVGGGNEKTPLYSSYMMDPNSSSPISLPPSSPYSPGKFSLTLQQGNIL